MMRSRRPRSRSPAAASPPPHAAPWAADHAEPPPAVARAIHWHVVRQGLRRALLTPSGAFVGARAPDHADVKRGILARLAIDQCAAPIHFWLALVRHAPRV